jgi:TDG/mug DNA glycosylase family protein
MKIILPDVLAENLRIVFCGTAAGRKSAQVGAYYAGPGNLFWITLYRVGLTPRLLEPHQFRDLLQYRIGLTDMAQRVFGADTDLKKTDFAADHFRQKIERYAPAIVAFNGKKAASVFLEESTNLISYGLQSVTIGKTKIFVLPSTSARARSFWDETYWQQLSDFAPKTLIEKRV